LSRFFGRDVELARAAQSGYTIDQYHPDEENYDPEGHRDEVAEARLGAAFFTERGLQSAVPDGSFFDLFPVNRELLFLSGQGFVVAVTADVLLTVGGIGAVGRQGGFDPITAAVGLIGQVNGVQLCCGGVEGAGQRGAQGGALVSGVADPSAWEPMG
jgi:hypothetical protein